MRLVLMVIGLLFCSAPALAAWSVNLNKDPITDKVDVIAYVKNQDSEIFSFSCAHAEGGSFVTLGVVMSEPAIQLERRVPAQVRSDSNIVHEIDMALTRNMSTLFWSDVDGLAVVELAREVARASERIVLRARFSSKGMQTMLFPVTGAAEAIGQALEACGK